MSASLVLRTPSAVDEQRSSRPRQTVVRSVSEVPLYELVPVFGPDGKTLDAYRGVRDMSSGGVVSVVSDRYGLVQHRAVAEAVHAIGEALDPLSPEEVRALSNPSDSRQARVPFLREQIRLYAGGRRMEVKLVIGRKFRLDGENEFYPAVRVFNSLDGAWALKLENYALRIACTNQLYAGARSFMEFRELHLSSSEDMLGQLQKAVYEVLDHFDEALGMYSEAQNQELPIREFVPALTEAGIPRRHVDRMAEGLPEFFGSAVWGTVSRWDAMNLATDVLSHEVSVSPERERTFERAAARALLLPEGEGVMVRPNP